MLISIVMPSLNQAKFIEESIKSVLNQNYSSLELIIADGGSNDGTLQLLQAYQAKDKRLRYFSRSDSGPANAINRALDQVRGTVIGWLNSDDLYVQDSILTAMEHFQSHPKHLMFYGEGQHIDQQGKVLNTYPTLPASTPIEHFKQGCFICQPTVFFKYSMFKLLGHLDENLKAAFDFDYWLSAFSAFPERIASIQRVQAYSRLHNDCITLRMRRTVTFEAMHILKQHLGTVPRHWLLTYFNELFDLESGKERNKNIEVLKKHVFSTINKAEYYLSKEEQKLIAIEMQAKFNENF